MEGKGTNPGVHKAYRLEVKRKLYIRCMRSYGELFKGKKELLQARAKPKESHDDSNQINSSTAPAEAAKPVAPYIWNSNVEGDEMCVEVLKALRGQSQSTVGEDPMTAEGIKI